MPDHALLLALRAVEETPGTPHPPFQALLLITLLALAVPVVVNWISRVVRFPIVVGEILAGMIVGVSGFGIVDPSLPTLEFLAEFGFIFLMFLSGLEINMDMLAAGASGPGASDRPAWQRPLWLAAIYLGLTFALAGLIGLAVSAAGLARNPILMGLILSTTSLGIVVPVLKERGLTAKPYGQLVLVAALLSDFVTLLLLSLVLAIVSRGLSLDLLLFLVLLAVFAAASRVGQWVVRVPLLNRIIRELSHATAQIRVRGALALMVAFVVLAESLGVEVILGAFLAGAIISQSSRGAGHALQEKLDTIGYGFFIPIFFIMVGARFDLRALLESRAALLLVPLLIAAAYAVKLLPALIFRVSLSWREALAAGALLSSRLSLIIAASAIALDLDIIRESTNAAVVLVAIVTCTASPLLFNKLLPAQSETRRQGLIIVGTDGLAELLAARLRMDGEQVTILGRDASRLARLAEAGHTVVDGPPDAERLEQAGAVTARGLIAVTSAPALVLEICQLARERFGIPAVIARADDPEQAKALQEAGARAIQPATATALALEGALQFPATFDVLIDKTDGFEISDVPLNNLALTGRALRRIQLPGDALVVGIRRANGGTTAGEVVVPHGDTTLQAGDVLMLVGSALGLREARRWLEG